MIQNSYVGSPTFLAVCYRKFSNSIFPSSRSGTSPPFHRGSKPRLPPQTLSSPGWPWSAPGPATQRTRLLTNSHFSQFFSFVGAQHRSAPIARASHANRHCGPYHLLTHFHSGCRVLLLEVATSVSLMRTRKRLQPPGHRTSCLSAPLSSQSHTVRQIRRDSQPN